MRLLSAITMVFCVLISGVCGAEQRLSYEEGIAWYSLKTLSEIRWPATAGDTQHRIGVFSERKALVKAFKLLAERHGGATIDIIEMSEVSADPTLGVILVGADKAAFYNKLIELNPQALFFTTFKVRQEQQFVTLLQKDDQISVALNIPNLEARGYGVSQKLLKQVGTRTDLNQALSDNEVKLKQLLAQVLEKEKQLEHINQQLSRKNKTLELDKLLLAKKEQELKAQQKQLEEIQQQVLSEKNKLIAYQQQINEQSNALEAKRLLIKNASKKITQLQNQIEITQRGLRRQQSDLESKQREMSDLIKTIGIQKYMMLFIFVFAGIFFIMSWVLYRNNQLRRAANRELKRLNEQLYELATTDSLTGLYNRRYFMEMANHEFTRWLRSKQPITFLMIDIDHFKQINDRFGHPTGDIVIHDTGQLLSHSLREYDLLGRVGGEEFAMMLLDCDQSQAIDIANRLCKQLASTPIQGESDSVFVTISIGISPLLSGDKNLLEAISRADKALYQAKQTGRNRVVAYSHQPEQQMSRS